VVFYLGYANFYDYRGDSGDRSTKFYAR